ncbi:hypothetical protein [Kiloniella antarctica]|uniref:DUF4440 domain-containing protein n=1 Tax=Kiloniella antarctica TaxID=1550907 RepID=A0ABW5BHQ1_9PROT
MSRILFVVLAIFFSGNNHTFAAEGDVMTCEVVQILTPVETGKYAQSRSDFINRNLNSHFKIIESKKTITAIKTITALKESEDPITSEIVYDTLKPSFKDIRGISTGIIGMSSIAIQAEQNPTLGHYRATLTHQSSFATNVWMLECKKL